MAVEKSTKNGCPSCGSLAIDLSGERDTLNRPILVCLNCDRKWPEDRPELAANELGMARKDLLASVRDYNQVALPMGREVTHLALNSPEGPEIVRDFDGPDQIR